jgi:hypothetical protein
MTPADSPRRIHLLTALLLVGTFAAGVVTGAGVVRSVVPPAPPAAAPAPVPAPPLPAYRLPREVRLTPEQDARAREIGERFRPELEALAREMRPKVRSVQDRMEAELLALLTPEQRRQLADIAERRRHPPRPEAPAGSGEEPPPPAGGRDRPPPPPEAVEACAHLDPDALCRFSHDGREHEGSCRRPPDGQGPLSCAPDRRGEPPPRRDRPR